EGRSPGALAPIRKLTSLGTHHTSVALPAAANLADITIYVFANHAAVTPVTVVIGVTAITGAVIIAAVVIAAAIARANAHTDAQRNPADPPALRAGRHRQCDPRRCQNSDCKLS